MVSCFFPIYVSLPWSFSPVCKQGTVLLNRDYYITLILTWLLALPPFLWVSSFFSPKRQLIKYTAEWKEKGQLLFLKYAKCHSSSPFIFWEVNSIHLRVLVLLIGTCINMILVMKGKAPDKSKWTKVGGN